MFETETVVIWKIVLKTLGKFFLQRYEKRIFILLILTLIYKFQVKKNQKIFFSIKKNSYLCEVLDALEKEMRKILFLLTFLIISLCGFSQENIDSVAYHVPGTDISFLPPKYFIVLPQKNTLLHPPTSSTIQVNEIDGTAYSMLVKNITPEYIEKQNAHFISRKDTVTDDGKKATLFLVSFTVEAKDSLHTQLEFERYMFFTGNYQKTIWINVNYPVIARQVIAETLLNSLLSVKFDN